MEYTLTRPKTELSQTLQRTHMESQTSSCQHKWALMADTRPEPTGKNGQTAHLVLTRGVSRMHTGGLTVRSSRERLSTPRKEHTVAWCWAGRAGRNPETKLWQLLGMALKSTLAARKPGAICFAPGFRGHHGRWLHLGRGTRATKQLCLGAKICYWKWVQVLTAQKPTKRQGWWKGKFASFQGW